MSVRLDLVAPIGRIVAGSVAKPSTADMNGKPRAKPQYFFAMAIRKDDPAIGGLLGQIYQFGVAVYQQFPHVAQRAQLWLQPGSQFAWKIDDGDNPKFSQKIGYPGHWVFKFTTVHPIRTLSANNAPINPEDVKTGYFVDAAFSISPNLKVDHTAGLFMNPVFVRLIAAGDEIMAGPSPDKVFTSPAPTMLPPGARPLGMTPPGMPPVGAPYPGMQPVGMQPPGMAYTRPPEHQPMGNPYYAGNAAAPMHPGNGGISSTGSALPPTGYAPQYANSAPPTLPQFPATQPPAPIHQRIADDTAGQAFPTSPALTPDPANAMGAPGAGVQPPAPSGMGTASPSSVPGFSYGTPSV